jgi:hypothetical protein
MNKSELRDRFGDEEWNPERFLIEVHIEVSAETEDEALDDLYHAVATMRSADILFTNVS